MGGAAELDWKRRSAADLRRSAAELDCNSVSSLVGMVLFSSCLVLLAGLEEKTLESKTWKKMRQTVEP